MTEYKMKKVIVDLILRMVVMSLLWILVFACLSTKLSAYVDNVRAAVLTLGSMIGVVWGYTSKCIELYGEE